MAPSAKAHRRTHSLLLLQKLLNLTDGAHPLTLVIDSLEQPAWPLVAEFASRARTAKARTVLLSFGTLRQPDYIDVLVPTWDIDSLDTVRETLLSHYPTPSTTTTASSSSTTPKKSPPEAVIFIDSLNALVSQYPDIDIAAFLHAIIRPRTSLVVVHHADVPVFPPPASEYAPPAAHVVEHLATAVVRPLNLAQELARQRARDRSLPEPAFGLAERTEGVLVGLCPAGPGDDADELRRGVVLDVEIRRRSGRAVGDIFVLMRPRLKEGAVAVGRTCLKRDYGLFARSRRMAEGGGEEEAPESTFDLGLTEKQWKDREGVVLPYFDAQTDIGGGEGGRILYDMGREDDFDEEEDEI